MTDSGFTLIETMTVVLLLGIVTTLALPSLNGVVVETQIDGATALLMGDLRYAQGLAIRTQQPHTVEFDAVNDEYRVVDENRVMVQHPLTRQPYRVVFNNSTQLQGVDLVSATFGGTSEVSFDALGAPQIGGTVTLSYVDRQRTVEVMHPTGRLRVQ